MSRRAILPLVVPLFLCGGMGAEDGRLGPGVLELDAGWRGRAGVQTWRDEAGLRPAGYALHRLRASIRWQATAWFGAEAGFQDARVFDADPARGLAAFSDPLEVRIARIRLGVEEGDGWRLDAGRQEVSIGEERLIGSDAEWCNVSRVFDGVRGSWKRGEWGAEALAVRVAGADSSRFNRVWRGDHVAAFLLSRSFLQGALEVKPHTIAADVRDATGARRRLYTAGSAWRARTPQGGDWEGEFHFQTGALARASALATTFTAAAPWERGRAQWTAGFTWASGGGDAQGRTGTFHDLYPAGHNGCGLLDPFAWRNLIDLSAGLEWQLPRSWSAIWEDHTYWLASRSDGLYVDGGDPLWFAATTDSRFAGHQTNLALQHPAGRHTITFGVAWLHTGGFVRRAGGPADALVAFASWDLLAKPLR